MDYNNAATIMTITPAPPAYTELSEDAAPMKFEGIVETGTEVLGLTLVGAEETLAEVVPATVGPALEVLLYAA